LLGFVGNETFGPCCLILDLGLPDMDGLAVLDRIRKDREQRLPVIGYAAEDLSTADATSSRKWRHW
jgi:CheY-like chemotaxis protein